MFWGLVSVVLPQKKLDRMIQSLYFKLLSFLGANHCITMEWYTLPECFQELGLTNFVVVSFPKKVFLSSVAGALRMRQAR